MLIERERVCLLANIYHKVWGNFITKEDENVLYSNINCPLTQKNNQTMECRKGGKNSMKDHRDHT